MCRFLTCVFDGAWTQKCAMTIDESMLQVSKLQAILASERKAHAGALGDEVG